MVNHIHVILRNRPDIVAGWSDEEVANRWWQLFPLRKNKDKSPAVPTVPWLSRLRDEVTSRINAPAAFGRGDTNARNWLMRRCEFRKCNNRLFCVSRKAGPSLNQLPQVTVKRCQELTSIAPKMQRRCSAGVLARTASTNTIIAYRSVPQRV